MTDESTQEAESTTESPRKKETPKMVEKLVKKEAPAAEAALTPLSGLEGATRLLSLSGNNVEAFVEALVGTMRFGWACQEAGLKFAQKRLQKNVEYGRSLGESSNAEDRIRAGAAFGRGMVEDHLRESQDMANMTLEMMEQRMTDLERRARTTFAEAPEAA